MTSTLKALVLVNPSSGGGNSDAVIQAIRDFFVPWGADVVVTEREGQATDLARDAARQGVPLCVAVGGDDTVREVIRGIVHSEVALGILPLGTFNNIAFSLGLPMDLAGAMDVVQNGQTGRMDLGMLQDGTIFTESVGVGFDTAAWKAMPAEEAHGIFRWMAGAGAGLRTVWLYRPVAVSIRSDGVARVMLSMMVTIANSSHTAARMRIAPQARLDDGELDVCLIPAISKLKFVMSIFLSFTGGRVALPEVEYTQAREITITGRRPLQVRVDNVVSHRLPVTLTVLPGILPIRLPPAPKPVHPEQAIPRVSQLPA